MAGRMAFHYTFNLKLQAIYGIMGFLMTLIILYLFTGEIRWIPAVAIGIANLLISGF